MYNYMKGTITEQGGNYIVLEVGGIGYSIFVSNPFEFNIGTEEKVYLYQHITEDSESLYGFKTNEAKNLFLRLLSVKGVGPEV